VASLIAIRRERASPRLERFLRSAPLFCPSNQAEQERSILFTRSKQFQWNWPRNHGGPQSGPVSAIVFAKEVCDPIRSGQDMVAHRFFHKVRIPVPKN
jgi:hypothetical protein